MKHSKKIKVISLLISIILLTSLLASCGIFEKDTGSTKAESPKKQLQGLVEGVKYVFDDAEFSIKLPSYSEFKESGMSKEQYDDIKARLEEEYTEELNEKKSHYMIYTQAADGTLTEHRDYYIFENGVIQYNGFLGNDIETLFEKDGIPVYSGLDEEMYKTELGTYEKTESGTGFYLSTDDKMYLSSDKIVLTFKESVSLYDAKIEYKVYFTRND